MAREQRETELGREVRCSKCNDFWPVDPEFYYVQKGKPHSWCKACYIEERLARGTTNRTGTGTLHNVGAR